MSSAGFGDSKLGGLPDLSYGPVTAQPAPVPNYDAAVGAWNKLSNDAQDIGNRYLMQQATQAGSSAVTRDAQGNLQSPNVHFPLTPADEAYNNAAQLRYLSESRTDYDTWSNAAREQYAGDPDGFRAALDAKTSAMYEQAPSTFQPALRSMLAEAGNQTYNDLWTQKRSMDLAATENSITAAQKSNEAALAPLIANSTYSNPMQDPAVQSRIQQNLSLLDARRANPMLNYTQAQHDQDANEFIDQVQGQIYERHADQIYQESGGDRALAEQKYTSLINSVSLPFQQQNDLLTRGLHEIREQDTLERQQRFWNGQAISSQVDDAQAYALSGGPGGWRARLPESSITSNFPAPRAAQIIEGLDGAEQRGAIHNELALASPAEAASIAQQYQPPAPIPASAAQPQQTGEPAGVTVDLIHAGAQVPASGSQAGQNLSQNNPGNLKVPGSDTQFQSFPSMAAGVDAVGRQVGAYVNRDGLNTISQIVSKYAPPSDNNNTAAYIADVAKRTGIPADQPITAAQIPTIRDALISHEQGGLTAQQLLATGTQAAQWKAYNAFNEEMKARQTNIDADPAQYVLGQLPNLQQQLASDDPDTRQSGYSALLATQAHVGVPASKQTVFTKDQAATLSGSLLAGSPDDAVTAMANATTGMTTPQLQIAARQLAPTNRAFASAISVAQSDPTTAANLLIGERYLLQNPDAQPESKKAGATFDGATAASNGWFSSAGGLFAFAPDARANAMAATDALYARGMIGQPTVKAGASNFDADRYTQAMTQALGGAPINVRGQLILPPRPGMDANDTEDMLSGLDAGAISRYGNGTPVLANGKPVSASDIAQHGVLTWTGAPGLYRVQFPGQGHLGVSGNSGAKTFMLNLGAMATGAPQQVSAQPGYGANWVQ